MANEVGFKATHGQPPPTQPAADRDGQVSEFDVLAAALGKLVTEKNKAYGSAYLKAGAFLRMLFPSGIHTSRYEDALLICRVFEKLMRLATRPDAFGESPWHDIAGIALLGIHKDSAFEGKGPSKGEVSCLGEKH